ncbi:MAG TPA: hypothetical protein VJX30_19715 [Terriglobales bacterium]|jgi:hypothetical protein|nr:hypothetical protein [Terriglobales bacterium]
MQADAVQLPAAPLKPTCHLLFKTGPCADSWRNYNQAIQQWNQLYVQQQQQTAAAQATAPLQQQIADERQQITVLQKQMQTDATAAVQARTSAHEQGLQQGAGIGVGASLILFGVIFCIRKLTSSFAVTKKTQVRAASAS